MPDVEILINNRPFSVKPDTSVAAALLDTQHSLFRVSTSGQPRAALCGMGICYECRVTINGLCHSRSCQILCQTGMDIRTG